MTNIKNFNAIVGIPTRKGIEEWKKQEVNSSISQKNYYSDYEQMLSYDWEGDGEWVDVEHNYKGITKISFK
jgi:hypothetical protein